MRQTRYHFQSIRAVSSYVPLIKLRRALHVYMSYFFLPPSRAQTNSDVGTDVAV